MKYSLQTKMNVHAFVALTCALLSQCALAATLQVGQVTVQLPDQLQIPVGQSSALPVELLASADTGCRIQARLENANAGSWSASAARDYVPAAQGNVRHAYVLVGAPTSAPDSAAVIVGVTDLASNSYGEAVCQLVCVPAVQTPGEEPQGPATSGDAEPAKATKGSLDLLQQLGDSAVGGVVWEVASWPLGYPYTKDPIVYAGQDIAVSAGIKNTTTSQLTLTYKLRVSKRGFLGLFSQVAELATQQITLQANETFSINKTWNTGENDINEYRFELEASYGFLGLGGGTIESAGFQIGRSQRADFLDCESDKASYQANETVTLKTTARIKNTGNVDLLGVVQVVLQHYDAMALRWDSLQVLREQANVSISRGQTYNLAGLGTIQYQLPNDAAGSYRLAVRLSKNTGLFAGLLEFIIGAKVIGNLENALPRIELDRSVGEDSNRNGILDPGEVGKLKAGSDKDLVVKYTMSPRGNSLREAGYFAVGQSLQTKLDVVFVCDTSGSMGNEWSSLLSILQNIIQEIANVADVKFDIYAMANYYSGSHTTYTVNGVSYGVVVLTQHETGHLESWGPATKWLADNYPWRSDTVRVLIPVSDEGAYQGDSWTADDTRSVDEAITACTAAAVAAFPMYGDWWNNSQGETYIKPNMQRLASTTGGEAFYWGDDQSVIDTLIAALGQQVEFSGRELNLKLWLTRNPTKGSVTSDAQAWLENAGNTINLRKIVPGAAEQSVVFSPPNYDISGDFAGYEFAYQSGNANANVSALFQTLSLSPRQQLELWFRLRIPQVAAGVTYTLADAKDAFEYKDAFSGALGTQTESQALLIRAAQPTGDLLVVVDEERMRAVYGDAEVNTLMADILDYVQSVSGTVLDVGEFRKQWEKDKNNLISAFAGIYSSIGVSECSTPRYEWNSTGPDGINEYPNTLKEVVAGFALARRTQAILLVGGDNVIPYHRVTCPVARWETRLHNSWYEYVNPTANNLERNIMWSDALYGKLNGDKYPDVAISRLVGSPTVMRQAIASGRATQPKHNRALCGVIHSGTWRALPWDPTDYLDAARKLWNTYSFLGTTDANGSLLVNEDDGDMRPPYTTGLGGGYSFIYTVAHGNDYREPGENGLQTLSQEEDWDVDGSPFDLLASAQEIDFGVNNPIWFSVACHHACTYADDATGDTMGPQVLDQGASAFMGGTIYMPILGSEDYSEALFEKLFAGAGRSPNVGKAVFDASRQVLYDGSTYSEMLALAVHHYGLPTVQVNGPKGADPLKTNVTWSVSQTSNTVSLTMTLNSWAVRSVQTAEGARNYITVPDAQMRYDDDYPPLPVVIYTLDLGCGSGVGSNLLAQTAQQAPTFPIEMPIVQNVPISSGLSPFSGSAFQYAGAFPANYVEWEVLGGSSGCPSLLVRVFPLQYDPSTKTASIHTNIVVTFEKFPLAPPPMVQLDVEKRFEPADGTVRLTLRNRGVMAAANIRVTETLPAGVEPDLASLGNAVYTPATNGSGTVSWVIPVLASDVPDNFTLLSFKPVAAADGDYQFVAQVEFESSSGLGYPPITKTVTASLKGESFVEDVTPDVTTAFNSWTLDRASGALIASITLSNSNGKSGVPLEKVFWYAITETTNVRLATVNGHTNGLAYYDVTAQIEAQLPSIGNGDMRLDPGESVTFTVPIYSRDRSIPAGHVYSIWADPPRMAAVLPLKLTASRSTGGALVLAWPASSAEFTVEEADSVEQPNWRTLSASPVLQGQQNTVTVPIESGTKFYRLKQK